MSKPQSVEFLAPPQETMFNSDISAKMNQLFNEFITKKELIEDRQISDEKRRVLDQIERELSEQVFEMYKHEQYYSINRYKQNDQNKLVYLQPYGSYYLQTHSKNSDIDTVMLIPSFVNVDTFMELITQRFKNMNNISHAEYIKGKRPIVNIIYRDVEVDLQPALFFSDQIERNINWLEIEVNNLVKPQYRGSIAAITTNAVLVDMMKKIDQFEVFQQLVRILKYAVDELLINKNKIGYLGGINISILAANLIFISKQKLSLCEYVYQFFNYYSQYDFKKPVKLNANASYKDNCPMQIVTLTEPYINSTSKVTQSTCKTIKEQFFSCKQSMEYLFKLINACQQDELGELLLNYSIIDIIFQKLIKNKHADKNKVEEKENQSQQYTTYSIKTHFKYFFSNKEYNGGIMVVCLRNESTNKISTEMLDQCMDKLEPNLITLFMALEDLKNEHASSNSIIDFIRPMPIWHKNATERQFFIGIAITPGDKHWINGKLKEIIINFRNIVNKRMEKEELTIRNFFQFNMYIETKRGKDIYAVIKNDQKANNE